MVGEVLLSFMVNKGLLPFTIAVLHSALLFSFAIACDCGGLLPIESGRS
jgi:hypothetical protein